MSKLQNIIIFAKGSTSCFFKAEFRHKTWLTRCVFIHRLLSQCVFLGTVCQYSVSKPSLSLFMFTLAGNSVYRWTNSPFLRQHMISTSTFTLALLPPFYSFFSKTSHLSPGNTQMHKHPPSFVSIHLWSGVCVSACMRHRVFFFVFFFWHLPTLAGLLPPDGFLNLESDSLLMKFVSRMMINYEYQWSAVSERCVTALFKASLEVGGVHVFVSVYKCMCVLQMVGSGLQGDELVSGTI